MQHDRAAGGAHVRAGRRVDAPGQLAALQQERLRGLIDRLLAADGVQAARLKEAGVTGGADVALGDLPRLPTTAKDDLWHGYPFGMLAVPVPRTEVGKAVRIRRWSGRAPAARVVLRSGPS
jgi:phenylacetate-coenzyme A ligase PaaK-like adenylate-forming protein